MTPMGTQTGRPLSSAGCLNAVSTWPAVVASGLELALGCRVDEARDGLLDADLAGATELVAEDLAFVFAFAFGVVVVEAPAVAAAVADLVGVVVLVGFAARVGLAALVGVLAGVGVTVLVGVGWLFNGEALGGSEAPPFCHENARKPPLGTLVPPTPDVE